MTTPIPEQWHDLDFIRTRSAPLVEDLGQCEITEHGEERFTLLLPTDGIVALIDAPSGLISKNLRLALGRVIAAHVAESSAPARPKGIAFAELQTAELERGVAFETAKMKGWIATLAPDFQQCRLKIGDDAALVFLLQDGVLPLAWAHFSTPEPGDAILLATADLLIAHRLAGAFTGGAPNTTSNSAETNHQSSEAQSSASTTPKLKN